MHYMKYFSILVFTFFYAFAAISTTMCVIVLSIPKHVYYISPQCDPITTDIKKYPMKVVYGTLSCQRDHSQY